VSPRGLLNHWPLALSDPLHFPAWLGCLPILSVFLKSAELALARLLSVEVGGTKLQLFWDGELGPIIDLHFLVLAKLPFLVDCECIVLIRHRGSSNAG
jgi:hypothetical protein